jgi:hypothetical protein
MSGADTWSCPIKGRQPDIDAGPAMTLDNMHALGVPSLNVTCQCGREIVFDASHLSGLIETPTLRKRLFLADVMPFLA